MAKVNIKIDLPNGAQKKQDAIDSFCLAFNVADATNDYKMAFIEQKMNEYFLQVAKASFVQQEKKAFEKKVKKDADDKFKIT